MTNSFYWANLLAVSHQSVMIEQKRWLDPIQKHDSRNENRDFMWKKIRRALLKMDEK